MVEVFSIKLLAQEEFLRIKDLLLRSLPSASIKKIGHYVRPVDTQRSLFGELMVRTILGKRLNIPCNDLIIDYTDKGKPHLKHHPGIHFNISHSGQWVVSAISSQPVGIDVEVIRPYKLKIAQRFFSKEEYLDLMEKDENERVGYFFELWTLKESYLKALGKGLTMALNSFTVSKTGDTFRIKAGDGFIDSYLRLFELDDEHKVAVCAFEKDLHQPITLMTIDDLKAMQNH
jgi:4'-phosphopantetheinyl transferase